MLKRYFGSMGALAMLAVLPQVAGAGALTLNNTYTLSAALSAGSGNYHPQGMGYDEAANELIFAQQSGNSIVRTNLTGTVLGTRTIGAIPFTGSSTAGTANHVVSVAADAGNYYFSDYTSNSGGRDLYKLGKTTGAATAVGNETAGMPVMFHTDVNGVKAFCASKSAAGSSSLRMPPTNAGSCARVGVSTASYGESAVIARALAWVIATRLCPKAGPDVAAPRSRSHRVNGRRRCSRAGSTGHIAALTDHTVSNTPTLASSKLSWTSCT